MAAPAVKIDVDTRAAEEAIARLQQRLHDLTVQMIEVKVALAELAPAMQAALDVLNGRPWPEEEEA